MGGYDDFEEINDVEAFLDNCDSDGISLFAVTNPEYAGEDYYIAVGDFIGDQFPHVNKYKLNLDNGE